MLSTPPPPSSLFMEKDFFSRLPPEVVTSILSRLSVRGVARSKCVCKPWLDLLCSHDFVNSYRSKSAALAVLTSKVDSNWCEIFDIGDELDDPEGHINLISGFDFPHSGATVIGGSANGLLLLHQCFVKVDVDVSYVCNPITREFVAIHFHLDQAQPGRQAFAYGFGASNVSGEYKLVRIESVSGHCHVHTLGTRQWRRVEAAGAGSSLGFGGYSRCGAFLNGKIHWSVQVMESDPRYRSSVACFDLEKECLSTFAHPPVRVRGYRAHVELFTLKDCLSFWDHVPGDGKMAIWVMKECGVEKSWTKEYEIDYPLDFVFYSFAVFQGMMKAFENGDILVFCYESNFFRYSIKTKTYQEIPSFVVRGRDGGHLTSLLFTPSFRSLKSLGTEDVITF